MRPPDAKAGVTSRALAWLRLCGAVGVSCLCLCPHELAQAQSREAPAPPAPPMRQSEASLVPARDPSVHAHNGFWFEVNHSQDLTVYRTSRRVERDGRRGRLRAAENLGTIAITLGGAVARNWSIGGNIELAAGYRGEASVTIGGRPLDAQGDRLFMFAISSLVRYYLPWWHLALTGSVGIGAIPGTNSDNSDDDDFDPKVLPLDTSVGFRGTLALAKLWWFSDNWSVGGQARAFFMTSHPDESPALAWGMGLGIVLAYQ